MSSSTKVLLFVASASLAAQGAQAQSLRDFQLGAQNDTRASAALTIPLGASRGSTEAKPRFDFTLSTQRIDQANTLAPLRTTRKASQRPQFQTQLSFTLENNPKLLMNGQRLASFGPRLTADEEGEGGEGLGTGGWILLGTAAAIGAGFLIGEIVKDDIEDSIRGD